MTIEDIESFGFKRLDDVTNPGSQEPRAVFSKLIHTKSFPHISHYILLNQVGPNGTEWHVKKEGVLIVSVSTREQLSDVIWVLSGFATRTFA